jgi:hypothetical protein
MHRADDPVRCVKKECGPQCALHARTRRGGTIARAPLRLGLALGEAHACHARAMRVPCACYARAGEANRAMTYAATAQCGSLFRYWMGGCVSRHTAWNWLLSRIVKSACECAIPFGPPIDVTFRAGAGRLMRVQAKAAAYVGVHGSERRYCRKGRAQSSTNRSKSLLSTASSSSRSRSGTTASARCCAHACLHLASQARADAHRFDLAARVRACLIRPGTEHAGW